MRSTSLPILAGVFTALGIQLVVNAGVSKLPWPWGPKQALEPSVQSDLVPAASVLEVRLPAAWGQVSPGAELQVDLVARAAAHFGAASCSMTGTSVPWSEGGRKSVRIDSITCRDESGAVSYSSAATGVLVGDDGRVGVPVAVDNQSAVVLLTEALRLVDKNYGAMTGEEHV